jgi:putative membrane protein
MRGLAAASALVLAIGLAGCERQPARGAEAAAQAADQPRPVLAAVTPPSTPVVPAQAFVDAAAASDAFETRAAQLALSRARNSDVRTFAQMMLHDHGQSAQALSRAVAEAGQALTVAASPMPDQQAQLAALSSAPQGGFAKAYVQSQVVAHQQALARLQAYAQNGDAPALQAFAAQAVTTVQRHLDQARRLEQALP